MICAAIEYPLRLGYLKVHGSIPKTPGQNTWSCVTPRVSAESCKTRYSGQCYHNLGPQVGFSGGARYLGHLGPLFGSPGHVGLHVTACVACRSD